MLNEVTSDLRAHILRLFPERQIYLRSGGEVKYYVLSTRLQVLVVSLLSMMAIWCFLTILNLAIGRNPLRSSTQEVQHVKAQYERLLADSKAKESQTRLMLTEQRENFEAMAKSLEEKHATLSHIMEGTAAQSDASTSQETSQTKTQAKTQAKTKAQSPLKYATSRVLMSPTIRDGQARTSRRDLISASSTMTGLSVDSSLNQMGERQDAFLLSAETDTLDKIERYRALIQATELDVNMVVKEAGFGKGGPYLPLTSDKFGADVHTPLNISPETGFVDRVSAIQARIAESEALEQAVKSMPLGYPIGVKTYQTSKFGVRSDPFTKRPTFHKGLDFGGQRLTSIIAAADGVVSYVGRRGAYGRIVEIDHGYGFKTRYAHLHKTFVKRGQKVDKGTEIAGMGSTGRSTATHLHYEVYFQGRAYDPSKFLKAGLYVQ